VPPSRKIGAEEGEDNVDDVRGFGVTLALFDELVNVRNQGVQRRDALFQASRHL
jgi:hypothetical protein